jgi:hypothetical protein
MREQRCTVWQEGTLGEIYAWELLTLVRTVVRCSGSRRRQHGLMFLEAPVREQMVLSRLVTAIR